MERVPFNEVVADMVEQDEIDMAMYDDVEFWTQQLGQGSNAGLRADQVMADARNYRELEALVKALDSIETMGSLVGLSEEYVLAVGQWKHDANRDSMPPSRRDFWDGVGETIAATKENMQPLLGNWLMAGISGTFHVARGFFNGILTPLPLQRVTTSWRSCDRNTCPRRSWHMSAPCISRVRACRATIFSSAWSWRRWSRSETRT